MDDTSTPGTAAAATTPQPPWPGRMDWPDVGDGAFGTLPDVLWSRRAISWYVGSILALLWMIGTFVEVLHGAAGAASAALGITMLVIYAAAFVIVGPLCWGLPPTPRLLTVTALFALSFTLLPWTGWQLAGTWTYVGVALGVAVLPWRVTFGGIAFLGALAAWFEYMRDDLAQGGYTVPAIVVSMSLMMAMFARAMATTNALRVTQQQVQAMAVERERGRMARDIHDILGHSLTVITVKAELAGRLVGADTERARAEVGDIERLARAALADVRTTVAGARGLTLSGELVAARAALDAAGIVAEVPGAADAVGAARRELAAWVVREGVTNVVRHSHAARCRVVLSEHEVTVDDDGVGPTASDAASTGLRGLRDRVCAAGGSLRTGRSELGGFRLQATL